MEAPEDELRDAMAEEASMSIMSQLNSSITSYDDQAVVFCPRSLRPAQEPQRGPEAFLNDDATQRRCWVLPPDPSVEAAQDDGEKQEQTDRDVSSGSARAARSSPMEKAVRRTPSASDRTRRTGAANGPSQRGGHCATTGSLNSTGRQQDAASDGPPLSARRRHREMAAASSVKVVGRGNGAISNRQARARSLEDPPEAPAPNGAAEPMVPISQLRRIEAQLATFRTRNGALEGEVAGLRSEAEAVRQRFEDEFEKLKKELQSKDQELKQRNKELLALQAETQETSKALQELMASSADKANSFEAQAQAAAQAAMTPAGIATLTPRITGHASPNLQLRAARGADGTALWGYQPATGKLVPKTPPRTAQRVLQQPRQVLAFP